METESTANVQQEKKGGDKKKRGPLIIALIVIALLVAVIVYLLLPKEEEKRNIVVTPDNVDQVIEQMAEAELTEPGYFEASMTNEWHFENGSSVSEDAYVANVANNTNDIFFDLVMAEDESDVIYQSPVIPLGSSLEQIALDKDLDAGTYDCVIIYHLVDEDQNTVSTVRVAVTVIVEG